MQLLFLVTQTRGVIEDRLECGPIITCQDGSQPIGFPDTCCPRCSMPYLATTCSDAVILIVFFYFPHSWYW